MNTVAHFLEFFFASEHGLHRRAALDLNASAEAREQHVAQRRPPQLDRPDGSTTPISPVNGFRCNALPTAGAPQHQHYYCYWCLVEWW